MERAASDYREANPLPLFYNHRYQLIAIPFLSLYQLLVSGSFTDNPLILFGVSVLPSLLLSSPLVWLFKTKFLPRFLEIDEEEEEDGNDSDVGKKKKKEKAEETKLDDVEINRL